MSSVFSILHILRLYSTTSPLNLLIQYKTTVSLYLHIRSFMAVDDFKQRTWEGKIHPFNENVHGPLNNISSTQHIL